MSTYMPKAGDITRTWYILDAEGQSLGRVAAKAAHSLRGKHKPSTQIRLFSQARSLIRSLTSGTQAGSAVLRRSSIQI